MIKTIKLTNFFSFREQAIDLEKDTNLLIGINGSGKSNFLKAIRLLRNGVVGNQEDSAMSDLLIRSWGGVDNIYCKSCISQKHKNSIGLEFVLNGEILSKFGHYDFKDDILYKIIIIKKPGSENYFISEKIQTNIENGFIFLEFYNGSGQVQEKVEDEGVHFVKYNDYNPKELALSKISEFDSDRYLPLTIIKKAIKEIVVYNYFDTTPDSRLRSAMSATSSDSKLLSNGSNLTQVLNTIKIKHKTNFKRIQELLKDVNERFVGFDFNMLGSGFFELLLDEDGLESSIHVTHISDGTLRYLCLLAILCNPNRGAFICIDEPEVGLHPDMIFNISNAIQEASEDSTMIIATHSENVLNSFKIENLRVFEKDEGNSSIVKKYTEKDFEGWYQEFSPGNMWRSGDLGGKRW